jgi:hypothetical protein
MYYPRSDYTLNSGQWTDNMYNGWHVVGTMIKVEGMRVIYPNSPSEYG